MVNCKLVSSVRDVDGWKIKFPHISIPGNVSLLFRTSNTLLTVDFRIAKMLPLLLEIANGTPLADTCVGSTSSIAVPDSDIPIRVLLPKMPVLNPPYAIPGLDGFEPFVRIIELSKLG